MQRLALAVLVVAVVLGLAALALRWAGKMARSDGRLPAEGSIAMRDGLTRRLSYVILFGVILGTSIGWLGDI